MTKSFVEKFGKSAVATKRCTRTLVDLSGKLFTVENVNSDLNVIVFCDQVFILGDCQLFNEVETHKTRTLRHVKKEAE